MDLLRQPKQHEEVFFFFFLFLVSKENSTALSMGNTMVLLHHHRHWGKPSSVRSIASEIPHKAGVYSSGGIVP